MRVHQKDVVVIGGGAAGLFCAIHAGQRGRSVAVLEHAERIGKKIAISGGGRCNFTNLNATAENFISANPHFCKSALARYTPADFVALVEKHGIPYHEKKLGQLFCDDSSSRIIELLLTESSAAGVEIHCNAEVVSVSSSVTAELAENAVVRKGSKIIQRAASETPLFKVETQAEAFVAQSLVVATGGLSISPLGATDFGYRLARQFGLKIQEARPALVPFTLSQRTQRELATLSGISIDSLVSFQGRQFRENILITHRGLSGPAILQISSYWKPGLPIHINLLPDLDVLELLGKPENREMELANVLSQFLPRRFAHAWCALNFPGPIGAPESRPSQPLKRYSPSQLADIAARLNHWEVLPAGTEGYRKAEVTAGGVDTQELSSQTMEAKRIPGLYFIGEVVDVTGQLGGYNFQWAWASGYAAGQSA